MPLAWDSDLRYRFVVESIIRLEACLPGATVEDGEQPVSVVDAIM